MSAGILSILFVVPQYLVPGTISGLLSHLVNGIFKALNKKSLNETMPFLLEAFNSPLTFSHQNKTSR